MQDNNSGAGVAGNGTGVAGGNSTSAMNASPQASTASPGGAGHPAKVAVSFMSRDTDAQFIIDTARIVAGMTGNAAFPTPSPTVANVVAARNKYLAAVTSGLDSRLGRSQRKKSRQALVVVLRQLAHYVEDTGAGDRTVLMSSVFPLQQGRTPAGPPVAPTQVRLVKGKTSGTAIARCRPIVHARAYQWRIAPAATPTAWLPVVTTFAAHAEFDGLTPTTVYVVQVCAAGTAGVGDWSETATVLVV